MLKGACYAGILRDQNYKIEIKVESGAGHVVVHLPAGVAALIHAATGMGKVIVDSRFSRIDKNTYQSSNYEGALGRVEINAKSGAGKVSVIAK